MKKIIVSILIIAIVALFLVPESMLQEYQGLLKAKYFLKDAGTKVKNIFISLIKGEKPKEFDGLEDAAKKTLEQGKEDIKEEAKDVLKESINETIDGL